MGSTLEENWKLIEDAINFYIYVLKTDEKDLEELSKRLNAKAEWINGLIQKK